MTWTLLCQLIVLFFVFSVLGWMMEVTLKYIQYHRFINRGFLIGPYCPIYGSGVVLVTVLCVLSLYISEYIKCAVVGGVTGKPARVVREKYWAYTEFRCWLDKKSFMTISFAPALAVCLAMLILMLCDIHR